MGRRPRVVYAEDGPEGREDDDDDDVRPDLCTEGDITDDQPAFELRRMQRFSEARPDDCATDQRVAHENGSSGSRPVDQPQEAGPSGRGQGVPEEEIVIVEAKSKKRITISLSTQSTVVCSVCGQKGHTAGFRGAVYVDCPVKPCYLCKHPGHTTATCPYRMDPTLDVTQAPGAGVRNLASALELREHGPSSGPVSTPAAPYRPKNWCIETACMRLHTRRVTCLDFVPNSPCLVASGDKKGHLAIWDFDKVYERTLYDSVHKYQVNAMKFVRADGGHTLLTSSADGLSKALDVESGMHFALCDLNPRGWIDGVSTERNWCMLQSITAHDADPHVCYAGDSFGRLHCLDLRSKDTCYTVQAHASHAKVTSLDMHPMSQHLLLSASNDYTCKLFDVRTLGQQPGRPESSKGKPLAREMVALTHPRVVSAAYFSKRTGRAILTTCQDNRLRVWDQPALLDGPASREMVHSHDFNRHLTPFRAVWDPKDYFERVFMIGRYISEDFEGLAVHPVDVLDGGTGALLEQLQDPNLELINPVNAPHPFLDVVITGSSGHLFCWRPAPEDEEEPAAGQEGVDAGTATEWELAASRDGAGPSRPAPSKALRGSSRYQVYDANASEKKSKKKTAGEPSKKGPKN